MIAGQQQNDYCSRSRKQRRTASGEESKLATKEAELMLQDQEYFSRLPTNILAQITARLDPADLVVLARTNKFFRNLLMSRSAAHIWRTSLKSYCGEAVRDEINVELMARSDVAFANAKILGLRAERDRAALRQWREERREYIERISECSRSLENYIRLEHMKLVNQIDCVRKERASKCVFITLRYCDERTHAATIIRIMSRLIGLGWSNEDDLYYHELWEEIRPKLLSLLEIARKFRLDKDRNARLQAIYQWLDRIRGGAPPLVTMKHSLRVDPPNEDKPNSTVDLYEPFPQRADISDWQVFQDLLTSGIPIKQFPSLLSSRRRRVKQDISTWQRQTEKHLASLVRQERRNGIPKPKVIRDSLFYAVHNPSYDAAILLRADVFFYASSGLDNYAYSYGNALKIPRSVANDHPLSPNRRMLTVFQFHSRGSLIARAFLEEMGRRDASFLEFHGTQRFCCGRCESPSLMSWEQIVNHYVFEKSEWEKMRARVSTLAEHKITYNYVHDLEPQKNPLIKLLSCDKAAALKSNQARRLTQECQCNLCDKASIKHVDSQDGMAAHIRNIHGITEPKMEHFKVKNVTFRGRNEPVPDERYIVW
ncbi:hypothetical protein FRC07_001904 [Ceratobasidium sp. 392]|nr:hypothetical protein FRC07_001904 [Ceratobasidium sp. 392]